MSSRLTESLRAYWDPESELVVLTLASAVLAGTGIALIMMGAMPAAATAPESGSALAVGAPPAANGSPDAKGPLGADRTAAPRATTKDKNVRSRDVRTVKDKDGKSKDGKGKDAKGKQRDGQKPRPLGRSLPQRLDIPSIGVHTAVMSLGLNPDGTVEVPPLRRNAPAGWYKNLSTPGEPGPAVLLGHVDTARGGPAVFFRLKELRPGDRISVDRADGSTARFTVRSVASYPKQDFPTAAVYGPRPDAELRLVTCGGRFDPVRRHYQDNIVVFAALS